MDKTTHELIEHQFKEYEITDALSASSITKYRSSLRRFFAVASCDNFESLTLGHCDEFVLLMKKSGASNSRIANVLSALRRVLSDMQKTGKVQNQINAQNIRKPKIAKRSVNYLTDDEIEIFIRSMSISVRN